MSDVYVSLPSFKTIKPWAKQFKWGREALENYLRTARKYSESETNYSGKQMIQTSYSRWKLAD